MFLYVLILILLMMTQRHPRVYDLYLFNKPWVAARLPAIKPHWKS